MTSKLSRCFSAALPVVVAASLVAGTSAHAGKPSWIEEAEVGSLQRFPEEDVVVLLHRKHLELKPPGDRIIREQVVYQIRQPPPDRTLYYASHGNAYRRLKTFEGHRFSSSRKDQAFSGSAFQGRSGAVDDGWHFAIGVDELEPGDIVCFDLEYVAKSPGAVSDEFTILGEHAVLEMEYQIDLPRGWVGSVTEIQVGEAVAPAVEVHGGELAIVALENILKLDPLAWQPEGETGLLAQFWDAESNSERPSWQAIDKWYRHLSDSALEDSTELRSIAEQILAGADDSNVTRALSNAVRDQIRYENVYLGDGGYRPHTATETWEQAWGDCKDKGHLLVGLLRSMGVEAYPVLVGTDKRTESLVVTPRAFDHVVVAVPNSDGYHFIDPTAKTVPFGRLPGMDEGALALIVGETAYPTAFHLPESDAKDNRTDVIAHLSFEKGGKLVGQVEEVHTGQNAYSLRYLLEMKNDAERREFLERRMSAENSAVDSVTISGLSSSSDTLTICYNVNIPDVIHKVPDGLLVWPNPVLSRVHAMFGEVDRPVPIDFRYPRQDVVLVDLVLPGGWGVQRLPEKQIYESEFVSYVRQVSVQGEELVWRRETEIRSPWVEPEDYEAVRAWDKAVVAGDTVRLLLTRP